MLLRDCFPSLFVSSHHYIFNFFMTTPFYKPPSRPVARLPDELILLIAQFAWFRPFLPRFGHNAYFNSDDIDSRYRQFIQLTTRNLALLGVCTKWRQALYGEYCRYVAGNCQLDSDPTPLPFLNPAQTREVWLRFDGTLLFGAWVIEWASKVLVANIEGDNDVLNQQHPSRHMNIRNLVIITSPSPNTITSQAEYQRAGILVETMRRALQPKNISFIGYPFQSANAIYNRQIGCGDKFLRIHEHFGATTAVTSIDIEWICHDSLYWLVANNVNALELLRVGRARLSQLQNLLFKTTADNSGLIFTRLRNLQLTLDLDDIQLSVHSVSRDHFPELKTLCLNLYPESTFPDYETDLTIFEHDFLTDLFFYCPGKLKILKFPISWDTVELLTPELLSQIRLLSLYQIMKEEEHLPDDEESNQLLEVCLKLVSVRDIHLNCHATSVNVQPLWICGDSLRTLDIPYYSFTIFQVNRMLEKLPVITVLACHIRQASVFEKERECTDSVIRVTSSPLKVVKFGCSLEISPEEVERIYELISSQRHIYHVSLPPFLHEGLRTYWQIAGTYRAFAWKSSTTDLEISDGN